MHSLDIVWVVVSPSSAQAFTPLVIRDNIAIVRKLFVADWANSILFDNLPIEQSPHFCG